MADVSAAHFVCGGDGDGAAGTRLGPEGSLFLHDYNDAVACIVERDNQLGGGVREGVGRRWNGRTNLSGALHLQDLNAFDNGGAGVVNAIEQGLAGICQLLFEFIALSLCWKDRKMSSREDN